MDNVKATEASLKKTDNVLLTLTDEQVELADSFCGQVSSPSGASSIDFTNKNIYLCGDIARGDEVARTITSARQVLIIDSLSHGYDENIDPAWQVVDLGRVPILTHGVGVYYRRFFELDASGDGAASRQSYFERISTEHAFQELTQSNKQSKAHRTGIYLTPVTHDDQGLHFRLLRCSTNLTGPTDNFRDTDTHIVDALNSAAADVFQGHAPLNHVLAQIYNNAPAAGDQKQVKARIQAHSDKTKDMPDNGIMAFCTFYDELEKLQPLEDDPFDWGIGGVSGLTKLHFKLKASVRDQPGCSLPHKFVVPMYPNSAFFMPLSTNRLYTHEIRPSMLDAEHLPTRLGYVVRCSSAEAVHVNGATFLKSAAGLKELEAPRARGEADLREFYAEENRTDDYIEYGDKFLFSMNAGDYLAPGV